jgi:inosose dehydratase
MPFPDRLAGAPISWGVCEVPGWGVILPPERVLSEMSSLGLRATEIGAVGWLPSDPSLLREVLARHELTAVAGFVPLPLHDPGQWPGALADARAVADRLQRAGARVFVSAAVTDPAWSPRIPLDAGAWRHLTAALSILDDVAGEHELVHVLHPHVGTLVETADDVRRVLDGSDVRWCLDTGHLAIGGTDPVAFASDAAGRIGHVHLKDVDLAVAARLNAGELTLVEATRMGLFPRLGAGDVAVAELVVALERTGWDGWYVLEQDTCLTAEPSPGEGPVLDVRHAVELLRTRIATKTALTKGVSS